MRKLTLEGRYSHPLFQRGGTEAQQLAVGAGGRTQASMHPDPLTPPHRLLYSESKLYFALH